MSIAPPRSPSFAAPYGGVHARLGRPGEGTLKSRGDAAVMIVCGLALLAAVTVVHAQGLSDPTRPPPALESPAPAAGGAPGAPPAPAGLQTIIRSNCAKPAAIINGEYVALGGRVGDARLVKIGEDSVTLKSAAGREILKLMPGVERKLVAPGAAETDRKGVCIKSPGEEVKK